MLEQVVLGHLLEVIAGRFEGDDVVVEVDGVECPCTVCLIQIEITPDVSMSIDQRLGSLQDGLAILLNGDQHHSPLLGHAFLFSIPQQILHISTRAQWSKTHKPLKHTSQFMIS